MAGLVPAIHAFVIPAQAGIQQRGTRKETLDPGFCRGGFARA
jgi:hypothetical protein